MKPIVPATKELANPPVMVGVAADSGCGKSTFLRRVLGALGTEVTPGHTAIGDMMTVICLDDYHINDRAGRKATGLTALDATENDFALMGAQMEALREQKAVYIDIVNDVKFAWKVQRDVAERGWTEEQVKADIEKRLPDFAAYVDPQKKDADVILRYEPSDQGLPYLKVKLIQKKGGAFPAISLKKEVSLSGSKPGAVLKQYDDDWYGSPVTVIEMDGEIDVDNMADQVAEIEGSLEGLNGRSASELTDAMVKLKESPGSQNGTGLLQAVIAMKIREVYDKLTAPVPA